MQGAQLIKEANEKFTSKDLMGALNMYEQALKEVTLGTLSQKILILIHSWTHKVCFCLSLGAPMLLAHERHLFSVSVTA